jgi:hypothetical protein
VPDEGAADLAQEGDLPEGRGEVVPRVLRVDAALDRVAAQQDVLLRIVSLSPAASLNIFRMMSNPLMNS